MNKLVELWDTYKTIIDDARNCYVRAQERGSTDPVDIAAPFVYRQLQRNPEVTGGSRGALFIGAYIANKYPHLQEDIIGNTQAERTEEMKELLLEVFNGRESKE